MKLLRVTGWVHMLFTSIVLVIAGLLIYYQFTDTIEFETTEKLLTNKERISQQIENGQPVTELTPVIEVDTLSRHQGDTLLVKNTWVYDPVEEEKEFFREIVSVETIKGKTYRITLRQVILEPHDYYTSIGYTLYVVLGLLLVGLLLINYFISRYTWRSFYQNLDTLKKFSVEKNEPIQLRKTKIWEFRELNAAVENLTERAQADYRSVKEFSEHASHEIQTPLAIIQVQLEELVQDKNLSEKNAGHLKTALSAVDRLSKLNQALLLITKIENRQFTQQQEIPVVEYINQVLAQMDDFIRTRGIKVEKRVATELYVNAHPLLMELLFSNLVGNAIKHNLEGGLLSIEITEHKVTISNTAPPLKVPAEKMFERFTRADPQSRSLGLGLSIVKKICTSYGWNISYLTKEHWHILTVTF